MTEMKPNSLAPEFERRMAELEVLLVVARHQANEGRKRMRDLLALLRRAEAAIYYKAHMGLVEEIREALKEGDAECPLVKSSV